MSRWRTDFLPSSCRGTQATTMRTLDDIARKDKDIFNLHDKQPQMHTNLSKPYRSGAFILTLNNHLHGSPRLTGFDIPRSSDRRGSRSNDHEKRRIYDQNSARRVSCLTRQMGFRSVLSWSVGLSVNIVDVVVGWS